MLLRKMYGSFVGWYTSVYEKIKIYTLLIERATERVSSPNKSTRCTAAVASIDHDSIGTNPRLYRRLSLPVGVLNPTPATPGPKPAGRGNPNNGATTFFAKISPNPSMTPLMKGSSMLIAREENTARTRARAVRFGLKIDRVTEGGGPAGCRCAWGWFWFCPCGCWCWC